MMNKKEVKKKSHSYELKNNITGDQNLASRFEKFNEWIVQLKKIDSSLKAFKRSNFIIKLIGIFTQIFETVIM